MSFAVIVQARMRSTRLPGKVLADLGGRSALARCLDRCAAIPGVDAVVCAVPEGPADDPVAEEALAVGARVSRGSETDVLARYAQAAREVGASLVMRVTADCPFIDPALCGQVRDLLLASGAGYACNNMPALFPHGLDCDVFPARHLLAADRAARDPYEREHVTPWLRRHPELAKAQLKGPGGGLERLRWTLDYAEDLVFARAVFAVMGEDAASCGWRALADLCRGQPELAAINARRIDEARLAAGARWGVDAALGPAPGAGS